jgi:hypothetical protein
VGYWAAYDREAAWSKVWFIVLAVLMYYALAAQPKENLEWVCTILFCIGFGVAIYFFLTQDFVALPRKVELINRIGRWVMEVVPEIGMDTNSSELCGWHRGNYNSLHFVSRRETGKKKKSFFHFSGRARCCGIRNGIVCHSHGYLARDHDGDCMRTRQLDHLADR